MRATPCDGALGTTLRAAGLVPAEPADVLVERDPGAVAAIHSAFVAAGARVLRTATLCTRPVDPPSRERLRRAVELARGAGPGEVWLSVGPTGGPSPGSLEGLGALGLDVDRVLLETFVDPDELVAAVEEVRASVSCPIVASLVPGRPHPTRRLRQAGASVLGWNCGLRPEDALSSFLAHDDGGSWWVAPADGDALPEVWRALASRVDFLGGCCGVGPARWRAAWPR